MKFYLAFAFLVSISAARADRVVVEHKDSDHHIDATLKLVEKKGQEGVFHFATIESGAKETAMCEVSSWVGSHAGGWEDHVYWQKFLIVPGQKRELTGRHYGDGLDAVRAEIHCRLDPDSDYDSPSGSRTRCFEMKIKGLVACYTVKKIDAPEPDQAPTYAHSITLEDRADEQREITCKQLSVTRLDGLLMRGTGRYVFLKDGDAKTIALRSSQVVANRFPREIEASDCTIATPIAPDPSTESTVPESQQAPK